MATPGDRMKQPFSGDVTVQSPIIEAKQLHKVYKLYAKPHYRFFDMIGLLRWKKNAYAEHAALAGIDLSIGRGEKVAIIGRNGAGKSTFLKLVTGAISPTSGEIRVRGDTKALLQIGTGFHPEFTGRENVLAYLACLGVTGREAKELLLDVVTFAELEEYVDQPFKTYSTGMGARLMFSAATVITPEILVLDEILGVGDAYFAQKSLERMKRMCDKNGTTVLLVSHDVYSASSICNRMIWLDRGRLMMDSASTEVIKAYEDSIRVQEELRLQLFKRERQKALEASADLTGTQAVAFEIRSAENRMLDSPVYFSRIDLVAKNEIIASLPMSHSDDESDISARIQHEGATWGEKCTWHGREARPLLNYGAAFRKIAGAFRIPLDLKAGDLALRVEHWSDEPCALVPVMLVNDKEIKYAQLPTATKTWNVAELSPKEDTTNVDAISMRSELSRDGIYGSGDVVFKQVHVLDAELNESFLLRHGEQCSILLDYTINKPSFSEHPQVVVAFLKDGVRDVCRLLVKTVRLDSAEQTSGQIRIDVPKLPLTDGRYSLNVLLAREGYWDTAQVVFFSISPNVYYCASRIIEIVVEGSGYLGPGTVVICDAEGQLVQQQSATTMRKADADEHSALRNLAFDAADEVVAANRDSRTDSLGIRGFDLATYVRARSTYAARVGKVVRQHVPMGGRILNYGSQFGNSAMLFHKMGYRVDVADSYESMADAVGGVLRLLRTKGIPILDCDLLGQDLPSVPSEIYDAIICTSFVERVPSAPHNVLGALDRLLKPGGTLILETPNQADAYNQERLARDESLHASLHRQNETKNSFCGHYRGYVPDELRLMLERINHERVAINSFRSSCSDESSAVSDVHLYRAMTGEASARELIITTSRKRKTNAVAAA